MKDFDYGYTNDTIQIIKAAGLFVPPKNRSYLALFIKILEIKLILESIQNKSLNLSSLEPKPDVESIFQDLKENLHSENAKKIDSFYQIYKAYETFQQIKDLMDVLGLDALSSFIGGDSGFDFTNLFSSGFTTSNDSETNK